MDATDSFLHPDMMKLANVQPIGGIFSNVSKTHVCHESMQCVIKSDDRNIVGPYVSVKCYLKDLLGFSIEKHSDLDNEIGWKCVTVLER